MSLPLSLPLSAALPVSSDIPNFGTDEWARFMEAAPENPEKFFNSLDELPAK
jgi:hypothetical protein